MADTLIDQLLAAPDLGRASHALSSEELLGLVDALCVRLLAADRHHAQSLAFLLVAVGERGRAALRGLLGTHDELDRLILSMLSCSPTPLGSADLLPYLRGRSDELIQAAIGAAGFTGDLSLAPEVFRHWETTHQLDVALCLGRLRAHDYTPHLLELVARPPSQLADRQWQFAAVALEAMADPACRKDVMRLLKSAPEERVWALVQVLRRVSAVDQSGDWIPESGRGDFEKLRRSWLAKAPPLGVLSCDIRSTRLADLVLSGTGALRLGYPEATTAGNWARWERALYWGDEVLFNANSDCPTCETYLLRAGASFPRVQADGVGHALADLREVSEAVLERLAPVLRPLPSGRYYAVLAQVPIERVDEAARDASWYAKRGGHRAPEDPSWYDPDDSPLPTVSWPGTSHYQRQDLLCATPPTSLTILPTQPLEKLDESTVAARRRAIRSGALPAALAIGWYEQRDIAGGFPEAMMQCVVIDGHHTLEAYAREGAPARLLVLYPWAFSWVPALKDAVALLTTSAES